MAGGFSEIYTALQFALLSLALFTALVSAWCARHWSTIGPWAAGWAGSAAALAAVALAPGSRSRQATLSVAPGLIPLILNAKQYALWFFRDAAGQAPLLLAVTGSAGLVGVLTGRGTVLSRRWSFGLAVIPVITFVLMVVCYLPAFYALQYLPPDRVLIVNWFLCVTACVAWSFLAGRLAATYAVRLPSRLPPAARLVGAALIVLLLGIPSVAAAQHALAAWPDLWRYTSTWDSEEQMLLSARANGGGTVTVARLVTPGQIDNLSDSPGFWVNQCLASYYGVQVRAIAPPPPVDPADLNQSTPVEGNIGGVAQVVGYHLDQSQFRSGDTLTVTVYWLPMTNTALPYTVFVHLYDSTVGSLGQFDGIPEHGQYPTTLWIHQQSFADTYTVPVKPGLRMGTARLILGLYDVQTGQRLPVTGVDAGGPGQDWIWLGTVSIQP